jgi:DNA-binding NarL/FixJ family response regulator
LPVAPVAAVEATADRFCVVLITAQPLFGSALCWAMQRSRPQSEVIAVGRCRDALEAMRSTDANLVLIDGDPTDCHALPALKALKAESATPVVIMSSTADPLAARQAIGEGAAGHIAGSSSLEHIASMLYALGIRPTTVRQAKRTANGDAEEQDPLTPAQGKVLSLIGEGQLNKQIAFELGIAESTVKAHVSAIFRKLKVQNRVQATLVASRQASVYGSEMFARA